MNQEWSDLCPKHFQNTELEKLPLGAKVAARFLAKCGELSIYCHGKSRLGKTRLGWLCAKNLLEQWSAMPKESRYDMKAMDATELAYLATEAYREGGESKFYRSVCSPHWLFIDDLGKARLTTRGAEALFTIIDRRMANERPTLITSNLPLIDLMDRIEDKYLAQPLMERIKELYKVV